MLNVKVKVTWWSQGQECRDHSWRVSSVLS